jgi:hypothetical protein
LSIKSNPDVITSQLMEREKDLTGFLDSQGEDGQRQALSGRLCLPLPAEPPIRTPLLSEDTRQASPAGSEPVPVR